MRVRRCVQGLGRWIGPKFGPCLGDLTGKIALEVLVGLTLSHFPKPFSKKEKSFVDET